VLYLAPDASASTRLPCLAYLNVPLSTHCKLRYVSKFTAASRGSPCDSTAFCFNKNYYFFYFYYFIIDARNSDENEIFIIIIIIIIINKKSKQTIIKLIYYLLL